jgi:hypothetical protein
MTKLLIATFITAGLLAGCGNDSPAPKNAPAASAPTGKMDASSKSVSSLSATAVTDTKPIVAPKPPPPPGGGQSAPELSAADIARIQEMLKKRGTEAPAAAAAASSAPAPAAKK